MFTLANAGINIHLKCHVSQWISQKEFRVEMKSRVVLPDQPVLTLDVTCCAQPPQCVKKGSWCQRGHPVLGSKLPLSIPPLAMEQGLLGELSVQFVTLLRPCVLQYPNLATELTHIQLFIYSSNTPVLCPSGFFQTLPAVLDCQELGLDRIYCSSFKDPVCSNGIVYTAEQDNWHDPERESVLPLVQQSLRLFFFLQHSDPFASQLADDMAAEVLIEHHLEDILNNNRKAIVAAVQTEMKNTLKEQINKKKRQEKLLSAAEVILSSSINIVSSSSNIDFRNACLNSMKVHNTQELSASLRESLWRVTSWKFLHKDKCYSAQMVDHPDGNGHTRTENLECLS
ncbi:type 2 DNA topoisomerase 6 subunit B-like [Pholidichthys leucotaenia]